MKKTLKKVLRFLKKKPLIDPNYIQYSENTPYESSVERTTKIREELKKELNSNEIKIEELKLKSVLLDHHLNLNEN